MFGERRGILQLAVSLYTAAVLTDVDTLVLLEGVLTEGGLGWTIDDILL